MHKLEIEKIKFVNQAFGRNLAGPKTGGFDRAYLDCETGEVIWVYASDEEAEKRIHNPKELDQDSMKRWRIRKSPARYLEIPGRTYSEQQEILEKFLDSNWTTAEALRERAKEAYNGSIDRWKRLIDDGYVIEKYRKYKFEILLDMAEKFLKENGIEPVWK